MSSESITPPEDIAHSQTCCLRGEPPCELAQRLAVTQADHGRRISLLEQREEEHERVIRENTRALLAARSAIDEARLVIAKMRGPRG